MIVSLFPIICIFWNSGGHPTAFFWYMLIILGAIVFQIEKIGLWSTIILIMVAAAIFLGEYIFPKEDFTQSFVTKTNILTVISSIILASFFAIVYMNKKDFFIYIYNEPLERKAEDKGNIEREREIALYNNIIEYIEKNKPFKDPDFSTHLLAKALNSNVNYISKAIQAGGGGNFNLMLNNFRINYFKSMLNNETLKKFTIDYLYNEAGYKYRSTFNNAFKNVTGMTPSEYISQLTSNDNA